MPAEARQKAHHHRGFEHAGAERVGEHDAALAQSLHHARHAEPRAGVEFERIGVIRIDAPPDHVGALQSGDRAHMDFAVAHGQIAALDKQKAEIAGEIGLFEIGLVVGAGRQQADARIGVTRHRGQAAAESLEEGREPLDIHVAVKRREGTR